MILRLGFAAAIAALVVGCQSAKPPEQQWSKRDATPEDVRRDLYWCSTTVEQRRINQTPADERRIRQVVDEACMEKRGYSRN